MPQPHTCACNTAGHSLSSEVLACGVLIALQTEMPYEYYSMPFCKPPEGVHRSTSTINPGTILLGIRIENSPYNFTMMVRAEWMRSQQRGMHGGLVGKGGWRV